jgi:hypothetical protein
MARRENGQRGDVLFSVGAPLDQSELNRQILAWLDLCSNFDAI